MKKKFAVGDRFLFVAEVHATNTWGYSLSLTSPDGKRIVGPGIIVPEPLLEGAPMVDRPIEAGCTVNLKSVQLGMMDHVDGKVEWTDGINVLVSWEARCGSKGLLRLEKAVDLKVVKP